MCFSLASLSYELGIFYWAACKVRGIYFWWFPVRTVYFMLFCSLFGQRTFFYSALFICLCLCHVPLHQTLIISPRFQSTRATDSLGPCSIILGGKCLIFCKCHSILCIKNCIIKTKQVMTVPTTANILEVQ